MADFIGWAIVFLTDFIFLQNIFRALLGSTILLGSNVNQKFTITFWAKYWGG